MGKNPSRANNRDSVSLRGATAPSGTKWIMVRQGRNTAWVPRAAFMTSVQDVKCRLAEADIIVLGADWNGVMSDVKDVSRFPRRPLLEQAGWTELCFALPSGEVFAPRKNRPVCLFQTDADKCARSGTLRGWKRRVAEPLADQPLATFMMMVPFVAPLLKLTSRTGNFGFELTGPPGTGKTTLLHLMASIAGAGADGSGPPYWTTCNTTVNAVEQKAREHSDLPLLLDDGTAFDAVDGRDAKGRAFKALVFALAQGETKHRFNGGRPRSFRLVYVLTSNQPLAQILRDVEEREAHATADRLLTLDVGLRNHGIFDHIPWSYPDATAFARALVDGMSAQHGTAMPAFLARLVEHRARDEVRLRAGIRERAEDFIERVRVSRDDGSAVRVAEAFGLVVSAGLLAQYYSVLPESFDCEGAAEAAYRLYQASTSRESYLERLLSYLSSSELVDMEADDLAHVSDEQFMNAPAFYRRNRDGQGEYLIPPATLQRAFADHRRMLENSQVEQLLQREGRHRTVKRPLRSKRADDRVHCFRFPAKLHSAQPRPRKAYL